MTEEQGVHTLEGVAALVTCVQRSVDDGNAETRDRLGKIEGSIGELKQTDKTLAGSVTEAIERIIKLEGDVERLKDDRGVDRKVIDRIGHETAHAVDGIKTHIAKVDSAVGELKSNDEKQNAALEEQTALLKQIKGAATVMVRLAKSPRIALYVAIGAIVGGMFMAIAEKVMH